MRLLEYVLQGCEAVPQEIRGPKSYKGKHIGIKKQHLLSHAVGGGEDMLAVDERAATELPTVVHEGRDPRPLALV